MLTWKSLNVLEYKTISNGFNLELGRYLDGMTLENIIKNVVILIKHYHIIHQYFF